MKLRLLALIALVFIGSHGASQAADATFPDMNTGRYRKQIDMGDGTVADRIVIAPAPGSAGAPVSPPIPSTVISGQSKVATAGTAVQLPSNALLNGLVICALTTNTGTVTIGGSGVTNTIDGTGNGDIMAAGQCKAFAVNNANVLWINATANGQGVSYSGN